MPIPFESIQSLELSAWPDLAFSMLGDWRLRAADGFSGRANSATALRMGADLTGADLDALEAFYNGRGLPALIRMTPMVAEGLDARLEARGYGTRSFSEYRMVSLKGPRDFEASVIHADQASAAWIAAFGRLNGRVDFRSDTMAAMLSKVTARATFASLIEDGHLVGVGMGVIHDGLMEVQSIAVDAAMRGRGFGRRVVSGLLAWGCANGAEAAILSVEKTNEPAVRLYQSLGFVPEANYHYRVKAIG